MFLKHCCVYKQSQQAGLELPTRTYDQLVQALTAAVYCLHRVLLTR